MHDELEQEWEWKSCEWEVLRQLTSHFECGPAEARAHFRNHPGYLPEHTWLLHTWSFALRLVGRVVVFTYVGQRADAEEDSWICDDPVLVQALEFALDEIVRPALDRFEPGGGLDLKATLLSVSRAAGCYVELAGRLESEARGGPARVVGLFGYDGREALIERFRRWTGSRVV